MLQGVLGKSNLQVHQAFEKFSATDAVDDIDRRFQHFKSRLWPRIRDSGSAGVHLCVSEFSEAEAVHQQNLRLLTGCLPHCVLSD